ncbi:MAG: YkvA family protein [Dehalococcoidia bacterium]
MIVDSGERESIKRILRLSLRRKLRLAWQMRRDPRVSQAAKIPLLVVIAYIVTPIHVLPTKIPLLKHLPFMRQIDDLIMAALGLWLFVKLVPDDVLDEHLSRAEKHPRIVDATATVTA